MKMKNKYKEAASLLSDLERACRRPLFVEVVLGEQKVEEGDTSPTTTSRTRRCIGSKQTTTEHVAAPAVSETETASMLSTRSRVDEKKEEKTWAELLSEASRLLPFLTEREHGEVLRLASVLLLGYLLPYSTGNELFLLRNAQRRRVEGQLFDPVKYVLQMSLEDRLDKSVRLLSANEFGEANVLVDSSVELAFDDFVSNGLVPLLRGRPFHREQVDLLHLFAMIIHPNPNEQTVIPETAKYLNETNRPVWLKANRLMKGLYASQFQIHYGHRVRFVKLVAEYLVLKELDDLSAEVVGPLLHGALPHLRASLRAFAQSAMSHQDAHLAHCALVSIASQTRNVRILQEEWDYLLHTMVEDPTNYKCINCEQTKRLPKCCLSLVSSTEKSCLFCPHAARGRLLSEFIMRSCRSRQDVDSSFLNKMSTCLSDAIEWQVDCLTEDSGGETQDEPVKQHHAACLLASLLSAASRLFLFLPSKASNDNDDPYVTLTESSIQLLRHPNTGIARGASKLLVMSLSHKPLDDKHISFLFEMLKIVVKEKKNDCDIVLEELVAAASQSSPALGSSLLTYLLEILSNNKDDEQGEDANCKLIASIASNCPLAAAREIEKLVMLLDKGKASVGLQAVASILSIRQARYFSGNANKAEALAFQFISSEKASCWSKYQMARHALVTGNFSIASEVYGQLLLPSLGEKHYLWMTALQKVSGAESQLTKDAAKGIPSATIQLRSALTHLHSLETLFGEAGEGYDFQVKFLLLRLDFLDLTTILRQLTREMRLTGSGPTKNTRSFLHLQNVVKSFVALSSRYMNLNRHFGMRFECGRSRTSLRVLQGASLFMALAARGVFSDVLPARTQDISIDSVLGNSKDPMSMLIRRLHELVVVPMDATVDPLVRAAAMLELIDGILMTPIPFPKDFLKPRPKILASLLISPSPEQNCDDEAGTYDCIKSSPALSFTFNCSGNVPQELLLQPRLPCRTLVLWYRLHYDGPLEDEDAAVDEKQDDEMDMQTLSRESIVGRMPDLSSFSPVSSPLFDDGKFFATIECPPLLDEGLFTLEVQVGCRDIAGCVWDIPLASDSRRIAVRVSRSLAS